MLSTIDFFYSGKNASSMCKKKPIKSKERNKQTKFWWFKWLGAPGPFMCWRKKKLLRWWLTIYTLLCMLQQSMLQWFLDPLAQRTAFHVIIHMTELPQSRVRSCVKYLSMWCDSSRKLRPTNHSESVGIWLHRYDRQGILGYLPKVWRLPEPLTLFCWLC